MYELTDEEIRTIARRYGLSVLQARRLAGTSYESYGIAAALRTGNDDALRAFLRAMELPARVVA